jgi:hypothetical protein
MNTRIRTLANSTAVSIWALALVVGTALAQDSTSTPTPENSYAPPANDRLKLQPVGISYFRTHDGRGINVFEAPKREGVAYDGFHIQWGAAFTQQFQALRHHNSAAPNLVGTPPVNVNQLIRIGSGFNNAEANLYMDTQLGRGIRVALTSYLSSRHHNETWVKDGYLLIDGSPWENEKLDRLMKYVTLRLGHFEINYGDMHFRRTDNGESMFNPLVGNLLMDAFTTEVGGEAYVRAGSWLGMAAITGGEVRGQILKPENRSPALIGKLGYDRECHPGTRLRITGSVYRTQKSNSNTLYSGSRSGSRYYDVLENVNSTESAQAWSGDVQPGMSRRVVAWVVNPFVTWRGVELFGNIEQAKGRNGVETVDRKFRQLAGEGLYRFMSNHLYVVGRFDQAKGRFAGMTADVSVQRLQAGGGWFISPNLEAKLEYVDQRYLDFPTTDIRNGGRFNGAMVEAGVSF